MKIGCFNWSSYQYEMGCPRKTAFISMLLNIITILLSQLSIALKHLFVTTNCNSENLVNPDSADLEEDKCYQIFQIRLDSIDAMFVTISILSIFIDLPANIMLFGALRIKSSWMFLPWLVVTKLKIIGCIIISCIILQINMNMPINTKNDKGNSLSNYSEPRY